MQKSADGTKSIGVKFVGSKRPTETVLLVPGTTTQDVLTELGLGAGFQLSDARKPEVVFGPDDILYARVEDGDLVHASALVDAGVEREGSPWLKMPEAVQMSNWAVWALFVFARWLGSWMAALVSGIAGALALRGLVRRRARRIG